MNTFFVNPDTNTYTAFEHGEDIRIRIDGLEQVVLTDEEFKQAVKAQKDHGTKTTFDRDRKEAHKPKDKKDDVVEITPEDVLYSEQKQKEK